MEKHNLGGATRMPKKLPPSGLHLQSDNAHIEEHEHSGWSGPCERNTLRPLTMFID
jgi:hypothetical protein